MTTRNDLYTRVTNSIIADLEQGIRPWLKPWNAEHAAGRITRPLRVGGQPYKGINVMMLWASAIDQNFTAPIWMTFKQAAELNANVKKGSKGSLVVYADRITRTETTNNGQENEHNIYFMKGSTSSRSRDSRPTSTPPPPRSSTRCSVSRWPTGSSPTPGPTSVMAGMRRIMPPHPITCRCHRRCSSGTPRAITRRWPTN
jgi:hypothetical protein